MQDRIFPWLLRAAWTAVPFTVWPAIGQALQRHSDPVRTTAAASSWVVWVLVLLATLVPHPVGLTALRCVTPALALAAIAAAGTGQATPLASAAAVAWSAAVAAVSLLPRTGVLFVNGPAYPNERRFPLGIPGALLLGPVELAWAAVAGLPVGTALLLATRQWGPGAVTAVAAGASVWILGRALHGLSRRWAVFVPAGFVLHDAMSLSEPVLFRRQVIDSMGLAPAGTESLDLTQGSLGLAVELRLRQQVPMARAVPTPRLGRGTRHREEPCSPERLLFSPTRPGAVLAEAATRSIRIATAGAYGPAAPPPRTSSPS